MAHGHPFAHDAGAAVLHMQAAVLLDVRPRAHDDAPAALAAQRGVEQDGCVLADGDVPDDGGVGRDARLGVYLQLAVVFHVRLLENERRLHQKDRRGMPVPVEL